MGIPTALSLGLPLEPPLVFSGGSGGSKNEAAGLSVCPSIFSPTHFDLNVPLKRTECDLRLIADSRGSKVIGRNEYRVGTRVWFCTYVNTRLSMNIYYIRNGRNRYYG